MQQPTILIDESLRSDLAEAVQQLPHPVVLPKNTTVQLVPLKKLSLRDLKARARACAKKALTGDTTAKRTLAQIDAGQASRANAIRERDFNYRVIASEGHVLPFGLVTPEMAADAEKSLPGIIHKLKTLPRGNRSLRRYVQRENERAARAQARRSQRA